jgi:radical SAM superfamily enzyme YgiQ (UPF0313 family)
LVNPPSPFLQTIPSGRPPLGLGYIKAYLTEQGYNVEIFDLSQLLININSDLLKDMLRKYRPDVLGISCMTNTYRFARTICSIAKKFDPNILTIMGGVHPTFCDLQVLSENPSLDIVVRGEGEHTMLEILNALEKSNRHFDKILGITYRDTNGQVRQNNARPSYICNDKKKGEELDCLPSPYLTEAFYMDDYEVGGLITARGCPFSCSFCVNNRLYRRRVRFHSVKRVIEEITHIYEHDRKETIFIDDDTFTVDRKRAYHILNGIIKLNLPIKLIVETRVDCLSPELLDLMKKAGVIRVDFGLESGSDATLRNIKKGITVEQIRRVARWINKRRLFSTVSFIIGLPEKSNDVRKTIKLAKSLKCFQYSVNVLQLYPGTELLERAKDYGFVYDEEYYLIKHNLLTQQEIEGLVEESFKSLPTLDVKLNGANVRNLIYQLIKGVYQNVKSEAEL